MIKACIFDLDGTLLDTLDSIGTRLCEILANYGVKGVSREQTRRFVGNGASTLVKRALDADESFSYTNDKLDEIVKVYVKWYNANPYDLTKPYEGIVDAISSLKARGFKLAVLSNKPDDTAKQLCEKFFPKMFDAVLGAREGVALKPDCEGIYEILKLFNLKAEETAYFGDTAVDVKTALNYGAGLNVGVLWGFRDYDELKEAGADALIKEPAEIKCLF